ncbi:hypothetical protein SPSIL_029300 [Sporomusa silvacetica DSM 10669]|uniref:Uncharacterized protein n=1 Tax=Sporomusa silvacetica DSM 10669 TaxID=1123289 RepID=A0ABZ3IM87_9FIRM|nr:hypothetical protein [Sporomusa silvacetica]OZC15720.1 hypothetical protein SPSIL_40500 [Sporomusa silvacetica DSM 10669]
MSIGIEQQLRIEHLAEKLRGLSRELKDTVDLSIQLRAESAQNKNEVARLWEDFLGQLFGYIKQRSKESRDNLLASLSWARMKLF